MFSLNMFSIKQIVATFAAGVGAIFFLALVFSTYYTVAQGERAVILHYGAAAGESAPGFHFKMPFMTDVVKISVQQKKDGFEFQDAQHDHRMETYTSDQQPATIAIAVLYHVTDATRLYAQYGSTDNLEENLIDPKVAEQLKNVLGRYTAISAVQDRAHLDNEVQNAIRASVIGPVSIDSVQIEDISFSQSYETAVEQRMQAIVGQQQAQADKQKRITNADAAAYEVKAAADAKAHQIEVEGQAQAEAIRARGDALKENPEMPALVAAEKWDGHLPQTMPPGAAVPFLNLKSQ